MAKLSWSNLSPLDLEVVNDVENKPGVYRLSYRSSDGSNYVFFVGRSDQSVYDDLLKYLNKDTDNLCIKTHLENLECYFRYTIVEDESDRKNIEKTLYTHFSPKCNLEVPPGEVIKINL